MMLKKIDLIWDHLKWIGQFARKLGFLGILGGPNQGLIR